MTEDIQSLRRRLARAKFFAWLFGTVLFFFLFWLFWMLNFVDDGAVPPPPEMPIERVEAANNGIIIRLRLDKSFLGGEWQTSGSGGTVDVMLEGVVTRSTMPNTIQLSSIFQAQEIFEYPSGSKEYFVDLEVEEDRSGTPLAELDYKNGLQTIELNAIRAQFKADFLFQVSLPKEVLLKSRHKFVWTN